MKENFQNDVEMNMPVQFKVGDLISEDGFFEFCQMNDDALDFERDKNGNIITMSPSGSLTGNFVSNILIYFGSWLLREKIPGKVFDSSTGFTLPNSAVRAPDIAWIKLDRWAVLPEDDKEKFAHICPDFVIEVRSKSDSVAYLKNKMQEYLENGCELGWLIDRFEQRVYIYQPNQSVIEHRHFNFQLSGKPLFPGFEINLSKLENS
ncbi:Uma2 family endonuclease [Dyadobacter sp. CY343]|uniref:Uma2 family endonuclease n=1 Tax=Dyadobacter sp. CY343 TaxID=2907299 RepID=UPI001F283EAE|nr:Uma2 family endonuclease [Dyadobacter sp. CY343]MCE7058476.1 Uma2 family endonuclease [Dyadobacter sp. CY343]